MSHILARVVIPERNPARGHFEQACPWCADRPGGSPE